jgi:hypothetical protein
LTWLVLEVIRSDLTEISASGKQRPKVTAFTSTGRKWIALILSLTVGTVLAMFARENLAGLIQTSDLISPGRIQFVTFVQPVLLVSLIVPAFRNIIQNHNSILLDEPHLFESAEVFALWIEHGPDCQLNWVTFGYLDNLSAKASLNTREYHRVRIGDELLFRYRTDQSEICTVALDDLRSKPQREHLPLPPTPPGKSEPTDKNDG